MGALVVFAALGGLAAHVLAQQAAAAPALGAKPPRLTFPTPADALPHASGALAILTLLGLGLGAATVVALLFLGGPGQDAGQRD